MARVLVALGLAAAACAVSATEETTVNLELRAVTADGEAGLVATDDRGSTMAIETAHLDVAEIAVHLPDGTQCSDVQNVECDDNGWARVVGPFSADLYTGLSAGTLTLPGGTYRKARAVLARPAAPMEGEAEEEPEDEDADTGPPPPFTAAGAVDVQGASARVEIGLMPADITFNGPTDVADGETLVLALDVSTWLGGVSIKDCLLMHDPQDGPFVIDETATGVDACSAGIADQVRANIEASGHLLRVE